MTQEPTDKRATEQTWDANPAGWSHAPDDAVGSKAFFERAYRARREGEIPFLDELIPWDAFAGKRVLEIGCGAGFDAYTLCEHGADYAAIDYAPKNPARARQHLAHFDHHPPVMRSDGERLPFRDTTFDVVFSNGVLHHTPDMPAAFREAHRVLDSGGAFWVVLYHKHSCYHWLSIFLFEWILKGGILRRSLAHQRSRIEATGADADVLVDVYSRGEVRRILRDAGLELRGLWVRKLPGRDLPGYRVLKHLYRFAPHRLARWCECRFGWYLTAHAVKAGQRDGVTPSRQAAKPPSDESNASATTSRISLSADWRGDVVHETDRGFVLTFFASLASWRLGVLTLIRSSTRPDRKRGGHG